MEGWRRQQGGCTHSRRQAGRQAKEALPFSRAVRLDEALHLCYLSRNALTEQASLFKNILFM